VALFKNIAANVFKERQKVKKMEAERRKHRRFQVKDKAFSVLNTDPVKLVPIIDIGMGGIGLYVNDGAGWLNESSKLEILVPDCSFFLDNLPFKVVSNFRPFPAHSTSLVDGRRYSLKFCNLSPGQKASLRHFIRTYSEGGMILQALQKFNSFLRPIRSQRHTKKTCDTRIWHSLHPSI
jgi:hypothetical protein